MTKQQIDPNSADGKIMQAVRDYRARLGWTVVQLMNASGVGVVAYQHDRGERAPNMKTVDAYAQGMGAQVVVRLVPQGEGVGVPNPATRAFVAQAVAALPVAGEGVECPRCASAAVGVVRGEAGGVRACCGTCGAQW